MRKMISAAVILVILFFLQDAFRYSVFSGIINIAFAGSIVYFIFAIINAFRKLPVSGNKAAPVVQQTTKRNTGNGWLPAVIVLALVIYFNRRMVGRYSFGTFAYIDRLVHLTDTVPPFIAWGMIGLLVGAVYGSIVAWRKYKLHYTVNLIPLGIFIVVIFVLVMVKPSAPQITHIPVPAAEVRTDSSIILSSLKKYIVNRWKVTDIIGRNRENFMQEKNGIKELEFRKNGKCFLYENGVRNAILYYTIAPDSRTLSFSNPNNNLENRQIQIISITKNELVIRSAMFENNTAILKAK